MEIGIQLSSLKPYLITPEQVFLCARRLNEMGYRYTQVQWASYDLTPAEIAENVLKGGLIVTGIQEKYDLLKERFKYFCEINRLSGGKDLCFSTIPERFMSNSGIKSFSEEMKEHIKNASARELSVSFHPTKGDFRIIGGKCACEILFDSVKDLDIVPDSNQLLRANRDPAEFISKYRGRIKTAHFKDMVSLDEGAPLTPVGQGITDFQRIYACLNECGCKYVLAEQETWSKDAFTCMEESLAFINTLG